MASIAALIGAQVVSGIGSGIASGLQEQRRRSEFDSLFGLKEREMNWNQDFQTKLMKQNYDLTSRGQNLTFGGNLLSSGMQVGSSIFGNLLSYSHAQDTLNFQKELNTQRRSDLQNEGLPLSYLHLGGGGGFQRSVPNIPMMSTQTFGRSVSNPWGYANSGTNLRTTYGPPPSYQQSQANTPGSSGFGFDPVSGYPK